MERLRSKAEARSHLNMKKHKASDVDMVWCLVHIFTIKAKSHGVVNPMAYLITAEIFWLRVLYPALNLIVNMC